MRFVTTGVVCWAVLTLTAGTDTDTELRRRISATLFVPDPLPDLKTTTYGSFQPEAGVVAERVTYGTEFAMRVPAIVYRPLAKGPRRPALIVVNGHGGDKYSWYAFYTGILYARAGAVVLTYDPIGEGERNSGRKSGTRAHDTFVPPPEMARRMAGLMITDVMQAVSYLRTRPDVDSKRIAAAGYSLGSFVLALGCALDLRLRACVLVGGGNLDGPNQYWDNSKKMCQSIPYRSLGFLGDRPAAIYALHASRGPTLIHNGTADETVAMPTHGDWFFRYLQARARAKAGGRPVFDYSFTRGGGHRPYFVTRPVAAWLHARLQFPAWTVESLGKMPETHISEWARARRVEMDKTYATQHREGGTRALGRSVHAPTRAQLTVISDADWSARKNEFVLERWISEARARCGAEGGIN